MMNSAKSPKRLTGKKLALLALAICMALQNSVTYALEPVVIGKPSKDEKDTRIASADSETAKNEFKDSEGKVIDATGKIISIGTFSHVNISESVAFGVSSQALGKANRDKGNTAIGISATASTLVAADCSNKEWSGHATAVGYNSAALGHSSVALGARAQALNEQAIAMGPRASASADRAIAIGPGALASKSGAIAIGNNATVLDSPFSIVIGNEARINNENEAFRQRNIAIGLAKIENGSGNLVINGKINVKKNDVAIGNIIIGNCYEYGLATTNGLGNIAVGEGAKNEGNFNVVIGRKASITKGYSLALGQSAKVNGSNAGAIGCDAQVKEADNAFAIGNEAIASNKNSFALGSGAQTSNAHAGETAKKFKISGQDYKFAGLANDNNGTLSIGKAGSERQIQNVAAGDITAKSTDAINGSQLHATNQAINSLAAGWELSIGGKKLRDIKFTDKNPADRMLNFIPGTNVKITGKGSDITIATDLTNIDYKATNIVLYDSADKSRVTLRGPGGAILTNLQAGALKVDSQDAVNGSQLFATNTNVTGLSSKISSVTAKFTEYEKTLKALQDRKISDDKIQSNNVTTNKTVADNAINIATNAGNINTNKNNIETNKTNIEANKTNIETNKSNIETNKSNIATNTANIDVNRNGIITNKQAIEANKTEIAINKVDILENTTDIATNKRNIATNKTNIATNKDDISTNREDIATNREDIATNRTDIATNKSDIAVNKNDIAVNKNDIAINREDIATNREAIGNLNDRCNILDTRINKVGAGAAALAALHPLDFDPNDKWNIATGTGSYRGQHALALGAFYRPDEDTMFNIASELGNGNNMWSVGVSFKFGRDKNNPAGRAYMAKEIVRLKAVNDTMQGEHQNMKAELNELKVKLEQLTKAK
jgi:hypothetical protein